MLITKTTAFYNARENKMEYYLEVSALPNTKPFIYGPCDSAFIRDDVQKRVIGHYENYLASNRQDKRPFKDERVITEGTITYYK